MANDREVLREIWEGRLPVCFQLNSEEVYSLQAPDPYYLMVPRLSYFPLVTDKVRNLPKSLSLKCKGPNSTKSLQNSFIRIGIPDRTRSTPNSSLTGLMKLYNLLNYVTRLC